MRLVLLADEPEWRERLQAALASLRSQHVLLLAKDWPTATAYLAEAGHTLLLATPRHRPASGRFPWPTILLLDTEPDEAPEGVVDWLNGADRKSVV